MVLARGIDYQIFITTENPDYGVQISSNAPTIIDTTAVDALTGSNYFNDDSAVAPLGYVTASDGAPSTASAKCQLNRVTTIDFTMSNNDEEFNFYNGKSYTHKAEINKVTSVQLTMADGSCVFGTIYGYDDSGDAAYGVNGSGAFYDDADSHEDTMGYRMYFYDGVGWLIFTNVIMSDYKSSPSAESAVMQNVSMEGNFYTSVTANVNKAHSISDDTYTALT